MDTLEVIRLFFTKNARRSFPENDAIFLQCNYLDEGIIDSMGIIAMIDELEEKFGIHFSVTDLQSIEFQTVGGLVQLVSRLRNNSEGN